MHGQHPTTLLTASTHAEQAGAVCRGVQMDNQGINVLHEAVCSPCQCRLHSRVSLVMRYGNPTLVGPQPPSANNTHAHVFGEWDCTKQSPGPHPKGSNHNTAGQGSRQAAHSLCKRHVPAKHTPTAEQRQPHTASTSQTKAPTRNACNSPVPSRAHTRVMYT